MCVCIYIIFICCVVCMYVCIYIYIFICCIMCMNVCVCVCHVMHMFVCAYDVQPNKKLLVGTSIETPACPPDPTLQRGKVHSPPPLHAHTLTCTHSHAHTLTCTHSHMHTHSHAHTLTCTHTCTHAHTHH